MRKLISRRTVLTAAIAGTAVVCLGGAAVLTLDERDMLRAMLDEMIGPYRMSEAEFEKFRQGVRAHYNLPGRMTSSAIAAAEETGLASLIDWAPESAAGSYQRLKRNVLTEFLIRTDYLSNGGGEAEVSYIGDQPCSSPFANFDFS